MWGRSLDDHLDDYLRRELDLLVPTWSPEGEWPQVLERASGGIPVVSPGAVGGAPSEANTGSAGATPKPATTPPTEGRLVSRDGRRRSAFAYAAISFAVLVLLAGLGTGIFEAVTHLGKDQPILVITDDTLGPAAPGQTSQTAQTSTASTGAWEQLPVSVDGGTVNSLVMDPSDPSVLYAGTDEGLFKSTDGAANWTQLPVAGRVTTIAVDPSSPSTVYVSADYALHRSLDGGATWTQLEGNSEWEVTEFWTDSSTSPATLYSRGTYGFGPFKSTDGGSTWEDVPTPDKQFVDLTVDPYSRMLYATSGQTLWRSSDAGATWEDVSAAIPTTITSHHPKVILDPRDPSRLYLYDVSGFVPESPLGEPTIFASAFVSLDRAETWSQLTGPELDWAGAVFHAAPGTQVDAIEAAAAFLSSFAGTVTDASSGAQVEVISFAWGYCDEVVIDPSDPSVVYVPTTQGVYKSTDQGVTWSKATAGMTDSDVYSVLVDPVSRSTIYAVTSASVLKSMDGGASWTTILDSCGPLALAPSLPSRLYARTSDGLLRSDDGGTTWTRLETSGLSPASPVLGENGFIDSGMLVASDRPDTILANDSDAGGVLLSTDGGTMWRKVTGPGLSQVIIEAPDDPSTFYAGGIPFGLFKSTDGGKSWAFATQASGPGDVLALAIDPSNPSTIYAVQDGSGGFNADDPNAPLVWRSTDGGETWTQADFPGLSDVIVSGGLFYDARTPGMLYAITTGKTALVFRSLDGGATWQEITDGLPPCWSNGAVVDPAPDGGLYWATNHGLFKWVPESE